MDTPASDDVITVVVVDDQQPFRRVAQAVLVRTPGFEMIGEADTGEHGVDVVLARRPALVLMDVNLPGISGLEATRRILSVAPGTVVFLCSTYSLADLPPELAATGSKAYIDKHELDGQLLRSLWDTVTAGASGAFG